MLKQQRNRRAAGGSLQALVTRRRIRELGLCAGAAVAAEIDPQAVHLLPVERPGAPQ